MLWLCQWYGIYNLDPLSIGREKNLRHSYWTLLSKSLKSVYESSPAKTVLEKQYDFFQHRNDKRLNPTKHMYFTENQGPHKVLNRTVGRASSKQVWQKSDTDLHFIKASILATWTATRQHPTAAPHLPSWKWALTHLSSYRSHRTLF